METLSGAKFEPFRDDNCGLRWFCSVKPTYSDREIDELSNCDKKNLYFIVKIDKNRNESQKDYYKD